MEEKIEIAGWQALTLVELGGITGNILEFNRCQEVITRLREIANDLEQVYGDSDQPAPALTPSNRPEIRALSPADALDYLEIQTFD